MSPISDSTWKRLDVVMVLITMAVLVSAVWIWLLAIPIPRETVFLAARSNDGVAKASLDLAAKRLGIKIAYLVNMLNPEVVVIGGGLEEAGEEFLLKVTHTVNEWAFREMTEELRIVYSNLRENAVALGVAGMILRQVFVNA